METQYTVNNIILLIEYYKINKNTSLKKILKIIKRKNCLNFQKANMNYKDLSYKNLTKDDIQELTKYVENLEPLNNGLNIIKRGGEEIKNDIVVYRGQGKTPIIKPSDYISTSNSINLVEREFTGKKCCIFKIHVLKGCKILDINKILPNNKYEEEKEIIIGNGMFYKNSELTTPGFKKIDSYKNKNKEMFETWYSCKKKNININLIDKNKISRAMEILSDEYELIEGIDDIILPSINLTLNEKKEIIKKIKEMDL